MVKEGDVINIDIPNRSINLEINDDELELRRHAMEKKDNPWKPLPRKRRVTDALKAYAMMTTSASKGAVRDISQIEAKGSK